MRCLGSFLLVSTVLCAVSCSSAPLDSPPDQPNVTAASGGGGNPGAVAATQGLGGSGSGGAVGGLGETPGSATNDSGSDPGSAPGCVSPVDGGTSGTVTSAGTVALEQEIVVRWNQAAQSVPTSYTFTWNAFSQFPHPTFKGGSEAAYGEFSQVLLAFFQRGDDFDFLARNCLFRLPLYYAMASGDHGQDWTFEGLAAYFASGVYGNTSQATRLALSAFSTRIQQLP